LFLQHSSFGKTQKMRGHGSLCHGIDKFILIWIAFLVNQR
jgi:hypothetical protein